MGLFCFTFKKAARCFFVFLWSFCLLMAVFNFRLVGASVSSELQDDLHEKISSLEQQIDSYRAGIKSLAQQSKTLKRESSLLDAKVRTIELEIEQAGLLIEQVEKEIAVKDNELSQVEKKLDYQKVILSEYLRQVDDFDQQDLVETVLVNGKLSDVFDQVNSLADIQQKIQESIEQIEQSKKILEDEKKALEDRRGELNQLKVLQLIQQRSIVLENQEKSDLLARAKGQESRFQALIAKARSDAETARNKLYLLEGIGLSMPLEQAYNYATKASALTGVRPAFLLAVLKRETSWGETVGTGHWRQDMNVRDKQAFIEICKQLNIDPDQTSVSRKASYGWGGAMGPAQFLPSVWLSYESKIAKLTGHKTPNPWDIGDAFVAAALKLAENGADGRTQDAEWKAAQIYFAGNRWDHSVYYFYGDQVMDLTGTIQEQLDIIAG